MVRQCESDMEGAGVVSGPLMCFSRWGVGFDGETGGSLEGTDLAQGKTQLRDLSHSFSLFVFGDVLGRVSV